MTDTRTPAGTPDEIQMGDALAAAISVIENQKCSCEYVDIGVGWQKVAEDPTCIRCTPFGLADAVLAAVDPVIRRQEREKVAEEIRAHADRHAPLAGHGVPSPLRRHPHIAARIAAGPMTVQEAAQAFSAAIARSHSTREGQDHGRA